MASTTFVNGVTLTDASWFNDVNDAIYQETPLGYGGTAGGTADALTLSPSPAISAYATGNQFTFKAASANTGAATVAVSGLAAKAIQNNGSALTAGQIESGKWYVIVYDGTAFQITKIAFPTATTTVPPTAGTVNNSGMATSLAASALTLALKDSAGSDPSSGSPVDFYFQSATVTTGTVTKRQVTAASSITIASTATAGTVSAKASRIYFGYLDNAGTLEPCWWNPVIRDASGNVTGLFSVDIGAVYTTVANTTSSDSAGVIYSTSARSGVRVIPVGYVDSVQTTAGTWAQAVDKVTVIGPTTPTTGRVLQTAPVTVTVATFSTASTTMVDITGMTVSITPSSKSNVVKLQAVLCTGSISGAINRVLMMRGSTGILLGDAAGSRVQASAGGGTTNSAAALMTTSILGFDAPDSTSSTTYKIQGSTDSTLYLNRSSTDTDSNTFQRGASTLIAEEICA